MKFYLLFCSKLNEIRVYCKVKRGYGGRITMEYEVIFGVGFCLSFLISVCVPPVLSKSMNLIVILLH